MSNLQILVGVLAVGVIGALLLLHFRRKAIEEAEEARARRVAEDDEWQRQQAREAAEHKRIQGILDAMPPLIDAERAGELLNGMTALLRQVPPVLYGFDSLATFEDADRWDEQASTLRDLLLDAGDNIRDFLATANGAVQAYTTTTSDERAVVQARVAQASSVTATLPSVLPQLDGITMDLDDRIDSTPNNKKAQAAVVRELRAQKKELQAQKKEARAEMSGIRSEASAMAESARPSAWAGTYSKRQAADERRAIRRAKDAALQPHEGRIAALDRQMLALERRIAWLQRFGPAPEDT